VSLKISCTYLYTMYTQGFKFPGYPNFNASQVCSTPVPRTAQGMLFCVTQLTAKRVYIYI